MGLPWTPERFWENIQAKYGNHPIRFRGSLRAQSVLVALQHLVMASTPVIRVME